jgi:hypothetical protein
MVTRRDFLRQTAGMVTMGVLGVRASKGYAMQAVKVSTAADLVKAVRECPEGTTIEIGPGIYELEAQLELKSGMTLKGAGVDKTIITHAAGWKPSTDSLPDPEVSLKGFDTQAYLIRLKGDATDITISDLTLRGPHLHGAIFGWNNKNLLLQRLRIVDFLWSGVRTFIMRNAKILDCEFVDAGGRWKQGKPGEKGGITGGAIFATWSTDTEVAHCRFIRTQTGPADEFYGIKVREAKRWHIHHNTIEVNFSIEMPHDNCEYVEIDHNVLYGTVSIPKYEGGAVPKIAQKYPDKEGRSWVILCGYTFHIHHNWFRDSYSIEFPRNAVEIDHNLFDFDLQKDHGNLISSFAKERAEGPASFHNNLISNPGRGVMWFEGVYNNLEIRNNHIIARPTVTPRKEGLFGFNPHCDFKSIRIVDNIIECQGLSRPLFRNPESYNAIIENNRLINVADADRYKNPPANRPVGLEAPLKFECGVHGEFVVDGWQVRKR